MKNQQVFDLIETEHKAYTAVIDYVKNKMVMFYDLTNISHPKLKMAVVDWKLNHFDLRFSIFIAKYYPELRQSIPKITVLNRKTIRFSTHCLTPSKPRRVKITKRDRNASLSKESY